MYCKIKGLHMTIGIFTAMEKEAQSFLKGSDYTHTTCGAFNIYRFELAGHDAVLCCPPSVGEIAGAAACQLLISRFKADVILNFGVVGALTEQSSLLSTVLVKSVVHYDMDTTQIDKGVTVGRYGCFDDVAVECDKTLIDSALSVVDLPVVTCASADKFVSDAHQKTALNQKFGAEICDMESAGVLFACKFNNVPCLLVKCISDSLFGGSGEYEQNSVKAAEGFMSLASAICVKLQ